MDIFIPTAISIALGLLAAWYGIFLKRAKLTRISGSGGGGGAGGSAVNCFVANAPGLIGIRVGETVILGKRIHGPIERGLPVERSPARKCEATLYDKASGAAITRLWWRSTGDAGFSWAQWVTMESSDMFDLMLFAREEHELTRYFPFQPRNDETSYSLVPADEAKFEGSREFFVRVIYKGGIRPLTFRVNVRAVPGQNLMLDIGGDGSSL